VTLLILKWITFLLRTTALESRKDLEAVRLQEKASAANIKVAKSAYYPQVSFIGGYTSLGLKNVVTVQNAINIGVGFSYDLMEFWRAPMWK
jgi:outer membrane protein TolC